MSKSCPDRQLLSVYLDGELPSPWKEKLERHVSDCPRCAGRMESYRAISLGSNEREDAAVSAAGDRVWQRLSMSTGQGRSFPRRRTLWRRSVSMPLPAAAALLILGLAFAWIFGQPRTQEAPITLASEAELFAPAQDMASVIEYLIGRSGSEVLMLRLPESQSFVSNGEPTIIRAADYSRQIASWQGRRRH